MSLNYFQEEEVIHFFIKTDPFGKPWRVEVNFKKEHDLAEVEGIQILKVIHIEPKDSLSPDMALVKVEKSPLLPPPIALSPRKLKVGDSPNIAVIGYPARDNRNDGMVMESIFKGIYNVKRLSPGKVSGVGTGGNIMMHDCTTLGGNSGSVVLDLENGGALGLHFRGAFKENNFAVTSSTVLKAMSNLGQSVVIPNIAGQPGQDEAAPKKEDMKSDLGYDPLFLGEDEYEVPVPELTPNLAANVVKVEGDDDDLLHYHHFSLKMHGKRRMAIFTAVNIHGGQLHRIVRKHDYWYFDPRIPKQVQAGKDLYYGTKLHRGHLVRRIDPAWGETREEAKDAAKSTFFYTNSTPQHKKFNPRSWLNLEDYILENADKEDIKVTVFTGPVFAKTDKTFRGIQMPEEYWKVIVLKDQLNERLSASGYIVSQQDFMNDLEFVYGEFKTFHVPISRIEKKTGINFYLSDYDQLEGIESMPVRVIEGSGDIMI